MLNEPAKFWTDLNNQQAVCTQKPTKEPTKKLQQSTQNQMVPVQHSGRTNNKFIFVALERMEIKYTLLTWHYVVGAGKSTQFATPASIFFVSRDPISTWCIAPILLYLESKNSYSGFISAQNCITFCGIWFDLWYTGVGIFFNLIHAFLARWPH